MIQVYELNKDQVLQVWTDIRGFLDSALKKYGQDERYPVDILLADLISGRMQGWVIRKDDVTVCAAVTEIIRYPLGDAVNVFLTGGDNMDEWGDDLHNAIVDYAHKIGAKWVDTASRRGLRKKFYDRLGYQCKQVNFSYKVNDD